MPSILALTLAGKQSGRAIGINPDDIVYYVEDGDGTTLVIRNVSEKITVKEVVSVVDALFTRLGYRGVSQVDLNGMTR